MRRKVVSANWKMNLTLTQTVEFINEIKDSCNTTDTTVVFYVPAINIVPAVEAVKGTNIQIGCQNMHFLDNGAYTGNVSADMLLAVGVKHVLVGHSERRFYHNETNEHVNKKMLQAAKKGMIATLCVGERLEEKEQNITHEVVALQVKTALHGVHRRHLKNIIIAYEPLWAIGTGKTATNEEAQEVCRLIREIVCEMYDISAAMNISIIYGGSVNKENAKELFAMKDIDGGLVGGASLKPDFSEIIKA